MEQLVGKYTTFEKATSQKLNRRKEKIIKARQQAETDKRDAEETEQTLLNSLREVKANLKTKTNEAEQL